MAQPIQASFYENVVSGFDAFDIHKPEVDEVPKRPFGKQFAGHFLNMREWMYYKKVEQTTFGHWELSRYHASFRSRAIVAASAAGATQTIVISASDVDSSNRFYPRYGDTVMYGAGEITGTIIDVDISTPSAPEIVVRPNNGSKALPALALGQVLIIISGAFAEATGQPAPAVSGAEYHDNDTQIIKETITVSGTEMTNKSWLTIKGEKEAAYYHIGQEALDYRMALKIDGAIEFQERTTNAALVGENGLPLKTTEGYLQYAKRRANPYPVASGAMDVDDFDAIDLIMEATDSGNFDMVMAGAKRMQNIDNALFGFFADSSDTFISRVVNEELYGGRKSQDAVVDFKFLTKSGRTHMFKRNRNWSDPTRYGADAAYKMQDWALFYQLNRDVSEVTGESYESIGYRYKEKGGYNRMMEVFTIGGAGNGAKQNDLDKRDFHQRCDIGCHSANGQQMVLMQTA